MLLNRSEEHTSELQSPCNLVCRLLLEKKKKKKKNNRNNSPQHTTPDHAHNICVSCGATCSCRTGVSCCHLVLYCFFFFFFFFNDTATTEIYTLSLHDALPI